MISMCLPVPSYNILIYSCLSHSHLTSVARSHKCTSIKVKQNENMLIDTQLLIRLLEMKLHLQEGSVRELCLVPRVFPEILMNGRLKRGTEEKKFLSLYKK